MLRFFGFVVLLTATASSSAVAYQAKVLSTLGGVELGRGESSFPARPREGLQAGDSICTAPDGAASVLAGSSILYLEAETCVSLDETKNYPFVAVSRGRVRVVVVAGAQFGVLTPDLKSTLTEGIYQFEVGPERTKCATVAGRAVVMNRSIANDSSGAVSQAEFQDDCETPVLEGECVTLPWCEEPVQEECDDEQEEERRREALQEDAADAAADQGQEAADAAPQDNATDTSRGGNQQGPTSTPTSQNNITGGGLSTSLGGLASSFSLASGGLFADAAQASTQGQLDLFPPDGDPTGPGEGGPFPGNIHLVTGESRYAINGISLTPSERDSIFTSVDNDPVYFSIGTGPLPNSQVFTDFLTASEVTPTAVAIPGFDAYVLKFTEFGLVDAGLDPTGAEQNVQGVSGLVGLDPPAPSVFGATPTIDECAKMNELATFALGEFRLRTDGGAGGDTFELAVRRSDQDRLIVKDGGGNDANDLVTPNPDIGTFNDVADPRFQPAAPTVKVPDTTTFANANTQFSQLNNLRRAAATTILADQLRDFSQRTGQTRFVIDGKIVDISGYQR